MLKKQETIVIAEGEAESLRLYGEGEASKIRSIGEAQAKAYLDQKDAIGSQAIALIETVKEIAKGNIKVVPDILTVGGNSESGLSSVLTKMFLERLGTGIERKSDTV